MLIGGADAHCLYSKGVMCGDSFGFFLLSGFFGALMLVALFRLVPPSVDLCFFGGGSGGLKSRGLFLAGGVIRCLFGVGQESGMSSARFTHLSFVVRVSLLWGMSPWGKRELCWLCYVSAVRIASLLFCVPL